MFSISNADELRERAKQTKQQQDEGSKEEDSKGSEDILAEQDIPTERSTSTQDLEEKPAPSDGDFNAVTPAKFADSRTEGGETEEMLMTEEQIDTFFKETIAKLTSSEERENIKANVTTEVRIPALLIKIQHAQLAEMGIDKDVGQAGLNQYSRNVAMHNEAARTKMEDFTFTCQRTYIELLREMEPKELETEAKMTPPQIMEFFEACDTLMALPETKKALRDEFLQTQVPPDQTIVGYQRSMLRTLGFEPDHGVACLNAFPEDYPDDEKLQQRLQQFMRCASMGRQEAVLGKEEMTKMMERQQLSAMKEHKMAMELQALGPDGREELAKRVTELNKQHAVALMALSTQEERAAYLKGIPEKEQWEMAKLRMLTMAARGGGDAHGHSHAHGHCCPGHDHGGHHHGHAHPPVPPSDAAQAGGHSHSHQHGEHSSHDHSHAHSG